MATKTTIEQALKAALLNLDVAPNGQVAPVFAAESWNAPYITFRRTGTKRDGSLSGPDATSEATFRITAWCHLYDQACDLAAAIRLGLCGDGDDLPPAAATEIPGVQLIECTDESDEVDPSPELDQARLFGRTLDFTIHYDERDGVQLPES